MGVTLVGHFLGAAGREARFAPDLAATVPGATRYREIMAPGAPGRRRARAARPDMPDPAPFDDAAPERVSLDGFGAVIFAGGFRPDFRSWLPWADAFDDLGFPVQVDGASTVVDGLYFVGTHFLRTRKSSTLFGVGEDAAIVAGIAARMPSA